VVAMIEKMVRDIGKLLIGSRDPHGPSVRQPCPHVLIEDAMYDMILSY
jgi:hypothetical protein